mmetsp:Transcript_19455/g.28104  ORF Transcript_19455/g.28104 Transcript_19455/m.28104 type:complete len:127 (+) Transcript_19455:1144-1524(+)
MPIRQIISKGIRIIQKTPRLTDKSSGRGVGYSGVTETDGFSSKEILVDSLRPVYVFELCLVVYGPIIEGSVAGRGDFPTGSILEGLADSQIPLERHSTADSGAGYLFGGKDGVESPKALPGTVLVL